MRPFTGQNDMSCSIAGLQLEEAGAGRADVDASKVKHLLQAGSFPVSGKLEASTVF
jgi:hypothetical protein